MPITSLDCAVCGLPAGRWHQWWNQDNGYGVCGDCAHVYLPSRGMSTLDVRKTYGEPGVHYPPKPEEEKPCTTP